MQPGPSTTPLKKISQSSFPQSLSVTPHSYPLICFHRPQTDHLWFTLLFYFPSFPLIPTEPLRYPLLQTFSVCVILSRQTLVPPRPLLTPIVPNLRWQPKGGTTVGPLCPWATHSRARAPSRIPRPEEHGQWIYFQPQQCDSFAHKTLFALIPDSITMKKHKNETPPTPHLWDPSDLSLPPINIEKHIASFVDNAKKKYKLCKNSLQHHLTLFTWVLSLYILTSFIANWAPLHYCPPSPSESMKQLSLSVTIFKTD